MILQDNKNLDEKLWKPVMIKKDMPHEQGLYGVKKRYYIPPKFNDKSKDFLRFVAALLSYFL